MDTLTPAQRSHRMGLIRHKGTKPELLVRRLVRSLGVGYRLHRRDLPGKPDLAFPGRKKVIFVHGCFWHRHSDPACNLARLPKSRQAFWGAKLEGNARRDVVNRQALTDMGWQVFTVWECELRDSEAVVARLASFLGEQ